MSSETYILAQACASLYDGPLSARELQRHLSTRGLTVDRRELQRILSSAKRTIVGLSLNAEHKWSFVPATDNLVPADSARRLPRTRFDRFVHQLARHYVQLEHGEEPTDEELATLRDAGGAFAVVEVAQLIESCEQARARKAAAAASPPVERESLAQGSEPHRVANAHGTHTRDEHRTVPPTSGTPAVEVAHVLEHAGVSSTNSGSDELRVPSAAVVVAKAQPLASSSDATPAKAKGKRKPDPLVVKAERREDGTRVERTYEPSGKVALEIPARILVKQLGSRDDGAVLLTLWDMPCAPEHFAVAKELVKSANGMYSRATRQWRFAAPAGWRVVEQLAAEGYLIERNQLDVAPDVDEIIYSALRVKFVGPEGYRPNLQPVVTLAPTGFVVEASSSERIPCSIGEALLMDDAGWTFTADAAARVRAIRAASGFETGGVAEAPR